MELLKALTSTPGVPGREDRLRQLISKRVKGLFDEMRTDAISTALLAASSEAVRFPFAR